MAFATATDLARLTGDDTLNSPRGDLLLQMASAVIRNHCRQTLDLVEDDAVELRGTTARRLLLPERPVVSVASVTLDGETVAATEYTKVRDGLWRTAGWGGRDQLVTVTYTHGFGPGSAALGTIEAICLQVAARAAANPQSLDSYGADGVSLSFGGGVALTSAEQAILGRFSYEKAAA